MPPKFNRGCGSCNLCCKLPEIELLAKPMGDWCAHADRGVGCRIYPDRPNECRLFHCLWLIDENLGPEWKPDKARFFLSPKEDGNIELLPDTGFPFAWKNPVYYGPLKTMSAKLAARGNFLLVMLRRRIICVLPDRDEDLGQVPKGHVIRGVLAQKGGALSYQLTVVDPEAIRSSG